MGVSKAAKVVRDIYREPCTSVRPKIRSQLCHVLAV